MIQMLLDKAEKHPDLSEDVFVHAVNPFVNANFRAYKSELTTMALQHEALRRYFMNTNSPWTDDSEGWASMIRNLN
jgi:hypothetical protein